MEARVVVDTLADKLAKVEILTLSEKHGEKTAHTLVTTLAYKLVQVESKITGETLTCMQRRRHRHLANQRPSWKRRRCSRNQYKR